MIQWVYEATKEVFSSVAVATEDESIKTCVESFGGQVVMTRDSHTNGTSRVAEAVEILNWDHDYVINVQGDEPMISKDCLLDLARSLEDGQADVGTLMSKVHDGKELFGESEVFVFSRSIIPFFHRIPQDQWLEHGEFYKHVGLYAYKPSLLKTLVNLPESFLEKAESLEQNRWLEHGFKIKLGETDEISYPVDTPDDVEFVRE
ncbi:UNVERIFIED_CONTAM: hypothetical protein GTU68_026286, partial [Idotea baltica]|nr:hypothetical protein [Idotea baltica]